MSRQRLTVIVNALLGQALWFVCVLGGRDGVPGIVAGCVAAGIALQALFLWGGAAASILAWMTVVAVNGIVVDSLLITAGVMEPARSWLPNPWVPVWLACLWFAFAQMVPVALRWLADRPTLAVLLGAVGGPMAYMAGHNLGAVRFPAGSSVAMVLLGAAWAWHFWFAFCGVPAWLDCAAPRPRVKEWAA
jgi:hypothetical protein